MSILAGLTLTGQSDKFSIRT